MRQDNRQSIQFGLVIFAVLVIATVVPLMIGFLMSRSAQAGNANAPAPVAFDVQTATAQAQLASLDATAAAISSTAIAEQQQLLDAGSLTREAAIQIAIQNENRSNELAGRLAELQLVATRSYTLSVTATAAWNKLPRSAEGTHKITDSTTEMLCGGANVVTTFTLIQIDVSPESVVISFTQQPDDQTTVPEACWLPTPGAGDTPTIYLQDSAGRNTQADSVTYDVDGAGDTTISGQIAFPSLPVGATTYSLHFVDANGSLYVVEPIDLDGRSLQ